MAAHVKTEENSKLVEVLAACGAPKAEIGRVLGVSEDTIERRYQDEYLSGAERCHAKVKSKLFDLCMDGDKAAVFFWLKTRCGWRETQHIQMTDERIVPALVDLLPKFLSPETAAELVNELESRLKSN